MNRSTRYLSLGLHLWSGFSEVYRDIVLAGYDPKFYMEDVNYNTKRKDYIILLLNTDYKDKKTADFEKLKKRLSGILIDDYVVGDIKDSTKHVLVLKLFSQEIREHFLKGEYSKMFKEVYLNSLKRNNLVEMTDALEVILKSDLALKRFKTYLNKYFDTTLTEEDLVSGEYDFPITYKKEKEVYVEKKETE